MGSRDGERVLLVRYRVARAQEARAALDVIDARIDIVGRAHNDVASTELDKARCVRCAFRHARVGRDNRVDIGNVHARGQRYVTATQRTDTFEEVGKVDPPCRRCDIGEAPLPELSSRGIDETAAVEPVDRKLFRRISNQVAAAIPCLVRDISTGIDRDVATGQSILRGIGRALLNCTKRGLSTGRVQDGNVKRATERRIGDVGPGGKDRRELVEQLHVAPGGNRNIARAGSDHLVRVMTAFRVEGIRARGRKSVYTELLPRSSEPPPLAMWLIG